MGLFNQIAGAVGGHMGQQGSQGNPILGAIMGLISHPQSGGLSGLLGSFHQQGLGDVANSWVSKGQNQPVSAEQVQRALGNERIQAFADQLGISHEQASGQLAENLPQVVDHLTPDGTLPQENDLRTRGMDLLKGKLFG